jgi:chemosensory pili system protein ChpA (sensor histidine kinase/response regulator)
MRKVLQALEQGAITSSKYEVVKLILEAQEAIQEYIEDNSRVANLEAATRILKKISNTLLVMQIHGGVLLANEIIKTIQSLQEDKTELLEDVQDVISRAIVRLGDYLEYVEAGNKDIPLVLMPLLNDLRASRSEVLISESVLFFPDIDGVVPPENNSNRKEEITKSWICLLRSNYQKALLAFVNGEDKSVPAAQLCKLLIRIQRASSNESVKKLWWIGSALAQAAAINAIEFNTSIASIFSSLDKHIKVLINKDEKTFAGIIDDNLIRNILYYVAIADDRGRIVNQVKEAFSLNDQIPRQHEIENMERKVSAPSGEVLITVSKALLEDIAAVKDCIELYIHSNLNEQQQLDKLHSGLRKIHDTLSMIGIDEYNFKIEQQVHELELIKQGQHGDVDLGLLGISEIILEIETCINNFIQYKINFNDTHKVYSENPDEPESSEHKAAYAIAISEILQKLEQVKELLTEIIQVSYDNIKLELARKYIKQIDGVVSMINIAPLSELLNSVKAYLESPGFINDIDNNSDRLRSFADCIVAFQCYCEQIQSNQPYGEQILDHNQAALRHLHEAIVSEQEEQHGLNPDVDFDNTMMERKDVRSIVSNEPSGESEYDADKLAEDIQQLPEMFVQRADDGDDEPIEDLTIVAKIKPLDDPVDGLDIIPLVKPEREQADNKKLMILRDDAEPSLVETFIEEAEEVIHLMKTSWQQWRDNQEDWEGFTEVRRGFHTLKGSGRLVGAEILAEFSWEFENLCNKCLGTRKIIPDSTQIIIQKGIKTAYKLIKQLKSPLTDSDINSDQLVESAKKISLDIIEDKPVDEQSSLKEDPNDQPPDTLQEELTSIFAKEASQHISVIEEALKEGNNITGSVLFDQDFTRTLHTIAGSAQTAGVIQISSLCSALENIISTVLKNNIELSTDQASFIIDVVGHLKDDLRKLEAYKPLDDSSEELIESLEEFNEKLLNGLNQGQAGEVTDSGSNTVNDDHSTPSMVDVSSDIDKDLAEIFFEEAEDVLGSCQSSVQRLRGNYQDAAALSELRRQFHTLKGSSRMAGYFTIGELSHITENLLVSMVDKKADVNDATLSILQRVLDHIHTNIDAAQRSQDIYLDRGLVNEVESFSLADKQQSNRPEAVTSEAHQKHDHASRSEQVSEADDSAVVHRQDDNSDKNVNDNGKNETGKISSSQAEKPFLPLAKPPEKPNEFRTDVADNGKERREVLRVQADVLDGLVNDAGEVSIQRSQLDQLFDSINQNSAEFEQTIGRIRDRLRELEIETETQILHKHAEDQQKMPEFDPLEMDRYSNIQQLSRSLAESVEDLQNIKETFLKQMQDGEDVLIRQKILTTSLQDNLLRIRMVKFNTIEQRLQRITRQTSDELGKSVELYISGGDNEIDRRVLNGILSSIEHILRNSIGHGIETPDIRQKSNKPESGKIQIVVEREGSEISITIKDDGAGINIERIKQKAVESGLVGRDQEISQEQALHLIFKSGLSTADQLTKVAGRGVGMDVVDKDVRHLGGSVEIKSKKGRGASFILRLPYTLAVSQVLLVKAGQETYALTLSGIEGVVQLSGNELRDIYAGQESSYVYAGQDYKLHNLASLLQGGESYLDSNIISYPVILVRIGDQRLALQVDHSLGNKEIVVKPLASHLMHAQGVSGATVLGDGKVALIIDIPWIVRLTQAQTGNHIAISDLHNNQKDKSTVMVVDDSITIRKVTTRFLERNNFKVVTAKDGIDALQKLQNTIPRVILLDIEMPRMDGYELATQIRKDERLSEVPIVMITSRTGSKHRNRALEIGVDGYLGKPYNEAQLLSRINEL